MEVDSHSQVHTWGDTNSCMAQLSANLDPNPPRHQYAPEFHICSNLCCVTDILFQIYYSVSYLDIMSYAYYQNVTPDQKALYCTLIDRTNTNTKDS